MFKQSFKVRDYELDMQGIVNNGVYFNYFEHARHEFLHSHGVDFAALAEQGINLVVIRSEIDFKTSLRSGDAFDVEVSLERMGRIKFGFRQRIVKANGDVCAQALVVGAAVNPKGRPFAFDGLDALFSEES